VWGGGGVCGFVGGSGGGWEFHVGTSTYEGGEVGEKPKSGEKVTNAVIPSRRQKGLLKDSGIKPALGKPIAGRRSQKKEATKGSV